MIGWEVTHTLMSCEILIGKPNVNLAYINAIQYMYKK